MGHDRDRYSDYDRPRYRSLRSRRLPHYHHPPRRRIYASHSALRLSITNAPWLEASSATQ